MYVRYGKLKDFLQQQEKVTSSGAQPGDHWIKSLMLI